MVQADVIVGEISIFQREKCLALLDSWENPLAARDALDCASSISYGTFVLSQLSVCILNCMDKR